MEGSRDFSDELLTGLVVRLVDSIEQDHSSEDYELSGMKDTEGGDWEERGGGVSSFALDGGNAPSVLGSFRVYPAVRRAAQGCSSYALSCSRLHTIIVRLAFSTHSSRLSSSHISE